MSIGQIVVIIVVIFITEEEKMKPFQLSTILRVLEIAKNPAINQVELINKLIFSFDPQQGMIEIDKHSANKIVRGTKSLSRATKKSIYETEYAVLKKRIEENIIPLLQESAFEQIAQSIKVILNDDDSISLKAHIGPILDDQFTKEAILSTDSLPFLDLLTSTLYYVAINTTAKVEDKEKLHDYLKSISTRVEQPRLQPLEQDDQKALEDLLTDADNGMPDAQFCLGYMYFYGLPPIPQNYYRAGYYLHKAALAGDAEAIYMLSIIFKDGLDVEQSYDQALTLLQMAADLEYPAAQFDLGLWYEEGKHVPKDTAKAIELWQKSAGQDNSDALIAMGMAYECGIDGIVNKNIGMAYKCYCKAKELGHPLAQKCLDELL